MLVPKLRFNEFKDEWKKIKLNKIATINPQNEILPNKFIYIDLESVEKGVLIYKNIINKENAPSRAQRTVKLNDILFQTVRPYQQNNYFINNIDNIPYVASTGYALLRTNEDSYFLYTLMYKEEFLNNVLNMCTGTSFPAINSNDLGTIEINLPAKNEQEKIGKLLKLLDKKIELQKQKIEALKIYKIGLFNKIYKEEMKTIKEEEIKKYAYLQGGYAFKSELFSKKGIPIIRIANINESIVDLKDIVFYDKEISIDSKFEINTGDILIAMSGATTGKIGIYKETMKSYLNQRVGKIVLKRKDIIYSYLYFLFELSSYNMQLNTKLVAGAQPNISPSDIETLKFKVPSTEMQEHIANMAMNINKKLEIEGNKLQELNKIKKGLLQKMFI